MVALDIDRMELLQCTLVTMDSSWLEMPIGHVTLEIGRARYLGAKKVYIRTEYNMHA